MPTYFFAPAPAQPGAFLWLFYRSGIDHPHFHAAQEIIQEFLGVVNASPDFAVAWPACLRAPHLESPSRRGKTAATQVHGSLCSGYALRKPNRNCAVILNGDARWGCGSFGHDTCLLCPNGLFKDCMYHSTKQKLHSMEIRFIGIAQKRKEFVEYACR